MEKHILVGLAIATLGCGSSAKDAGPPTVAIRGVLAPAPGLVSSDFTVWGPADVAPGEVGTDGGWTVQGNDHRTGIVFAAPKPGSAAAVSLGPESGLYMTPVAASARLVKNGSAGMAQDGGAADSGFTTSAPPATAGYSVASDGPAAMDATTTVLAMLLMHPMLGHPSASVSSEQLRWMVTRMTSGWPCLAEAARVYDANLVARVDFSTNPAFTAALTTCLDELSAMPVFTPTAPPAGKQALQPRPAGALDRGGRYYAGDREPVQYSMAKAGVVVSKLERTSVDEDSVVMTPKTANGTALEYYYTVKEIDGALTRFGTESPVFASPNQLELHATGSTLAAGFISSSSYWTYLDVVGNTFRKASELLSGTVVAAPNSSVTLSAQKMYEVRLYSGGFGIGANAAAYDFATANLASEHDTALYQNVTMAVVELIGVIPGAGEVLGEGDGGKILQAVVQKVIVEVRALVAAKGANVTGDDLYNLMHSIFKGAVDDAMEIVTENAQAGLAEKLLGFVVGGGKKVFKTVVGLPGKVAKGGTLGNRAFRLSNPESVLEYYVVAVGYPTGDCEPMMEVMSIYLGAYPADCVACANLACAVECTDCGDSCLDAEDEIMTTYLEACRTCNASEAGSTKCDDAKLKAAGAGAFTPGSGQPKELAYEAYGCILSACSACLDWNEGPKVCTFPP